MNRIGGNYSRTTLLTGLVGMTAAVPVAMQSQSLSGTPTFYILIGALASLSSSVVLRNIFPTPEPNTKARELDTLELQQEVSALNQHAMVTMTDSRGKICFANQRFLDSTGYSTHDVIGMSPCNFYAEEERTTLKDIESILGAGHSWSGETLLRRRDGKVIVTQTTIVPRIDGSKRWVGAVAVRTDITAARMQQSERDAVSSLHRLAEPIAMIDPETLKIVYMNEAASALTGWVTDTLAAARHSINPVDATTQDLRRTLERLIFGADEQARVTLTMDGRMFEADIQKITSQIGPDRLFMIMRDVTGAAELERVKHDFIANVSHELRTPLTAIKGSLGLVLAGVAGEVSSKAEALVEIAHRNADRLVLIVNDILDLEKIAAGQMAFEMERGDLRVALDEAVLALRSYADQFDVSIELSQPEEPVHARFDSARIVQVLTNLISNAAKFSNRGSEIAVDLFSDDDWHHVRVSDQGAGIPAADMPTIFDRFSQAGGAERRSKGGTGLGLNIVKAIVEKHGGTVDLQSTEGVGTTIAFCLRREDTAAALPADPEKRE